MLMLIIVFSVLLLLWGGLLSYFFSSLVLVFFLLVVGLLNMKGFFFDLSYSVYQVYECGFCEINSLNNYYTMQFFVIVLSFMLFDMEIILILPLMYVSEASTSSLFLSVIFLSLLLFSLFYEMMFNVFKW